MNLHDDNDQIVETLFRNGTITVVGIVLSFSLSFLTQWANNPLPWNLVDLPPVFLIIAGIVCQIMALAILLRIASLQHNIYAKANRRFLIGVVLTGLGIVLAIIIDAVKLVP
ncbi:hypothetical protein [Pseudaminobacter salicylatoxidans]|uniref:hypothetical protein n=1 Tax=Pseudaminobacter salicylatoxidans TaxID=93369 RepID=UPI00031DFC28|nr:hypothetical protein [Pseudaminobacter salicylatoxidans]